MARTVFIANAALTLPFAVLGLIAPAWVFLLFGIELDVGGQLAARGYASTLLGYGAVYLMLRDFDTPEVVRALLVASAAFNAAETVVQTSAGLAGTTSPVVWITVAVHAVLAVLSALELRDR
ncbi:MAG: hypothetical protein H6713_05045 [Myxococcales bacterium]|nr:hypothetical protein [Myxococcales bacterium]